MTICGIAVRHRGTGRATRSTRLGTSHAYYISAGEVSAGLMETHVRQTYIVIDTRTGRPVGGTYTSVHTAQRAADRRDLDYGAVRYIVQRAQPAMPMAQAILSAGPL